jgi:hypothetical protein
VKESGFGANPNKLSPIGAGAPAGGDPALLLEPEAAAADGGGGVFNCATGMPPFFFFLGTFTTVDFASPATPSAMVSDLPGHCHRRRAC